MTKHLWYRVVPEGIRLFVRVTPRAPKNMLLPPNGPGRLVVKVTKPAIEGEANAAVVEYLADVFDCAKSHVVIEGGETAREKKILLRGMSEQLFIQRLPFFLL